MERLFGTDGVRGIVNRDLTCEMAFRLGQAGACVLAGSVRQATILVGRDPRISGEMLESALVAGICSMGARPLQVGVLPTPAIAYLTRTYQADAGVVISASHNAVAYNGIKFFDANGYKLPDEVEDRMEVIVREGLPDSWALPVGAGVGRPVRQGNAKRRYIEFVKSCADVRLDGLRIVLDCAQGAASEVAPVIFRELGADVAAYCHEPDGSNINEHCGSTHPQRMCELVRELGADAGLAFDGDADRLIASDEQGNPVDGDQVMCICAVEMQARGTLKHNTLVTTVMSNLGLELALKERGIRQVKTKVGDRYVLEEMLASGCNLGGEQSGHVIFLDHNTTGDGIITALKLLQAVVSAGKPLSELAGRMTVLPQTQYTASVPESAKAAYGKHPVVQEAIAAMEAKYAGTGRVLVRPSGTEPVIRVMIEGQDRKEIEQDAYTLAKLIEKEMNT